LLGTFAGTDLAADGFVAGFAEAMGVDGAFETGSAFAWTLGRTVVVAPALDGKS
jgi:hypothetical protein